MRPMRLAMLLCATIGLAGCEGMSQTEQRVGVGALGGGAIGGVIGSFSGNAGLGALIGAGAGGLGGYVYDQSQQSQRSSRGYNRQYRDNRGS
jgi:uncharacterized protein YcfJ